MWNLLQAQETSFLRGIDLVYIIGIISTVVGAVWAFYRFRYEKKLDKFKDANADLFTDDKQKKLAAIATLSVFKSDRTFGKSTTNVLLSKLYTETDYDITYAIGSALIQFSSKRTLLKIAAEIAGINRNFYSQTAPYEQRSSTIVNLFERAYKIQNNQADGSPVKAIEKEKDVLDTRYARYKTEYLTVNEKIAYEIFTQEQITADAYSRIIREAAEKAAKRLFFQRGFRLYIYQNVFANIQLVRIATRKSTVWRSSFQSATIADVHFGKPTIYDCTFAGAYLSDCSITNGTVFSSVMTGMAMNNVVFEKITFFEIFFAGTVFTDCNFSSCKGLMPESFYGCEIDQGTQLPGFTREDVYKLRAGAVMEEVLNSSLTQEDKENILLAQANKIRSTEDIFDINNLPISKRLKDDMIIAVSSSVKLKDLFDSIMIYQAEESSKWYMIFLLLYSKTLHELVVDLYDTVSINNDQLKYVLESLWPDKTTEDYRIAIEESVLTKDEKMIFTQRIITIFTVHVRKTPVKKKNNEKEIQQ